MVRWNSTNHLSNIRQATPRICFISLESTARIRFKKFKKCPAQSNPRERIIPPVLRRLTRKTRFDRHENNTRKRRFHPDLQDCTRSREGKLVRWKQNIKTLAKHNMSKTSISALLWAKIRKRDENALPYGGPMEQSIILRPIKGVKINSFKFVIFIST